MWGFFHYRRQLTHAVFLIQSFGLYGVGFSVLLMAVLAVIPVPSEFFVVVNMEVYGVFWGLLYSWIGAIIGAVWAMYLTRWLGQTWLRRWLVRLLPPERQRQVDDWVTRRGAIGLLTLRFVPVVPFHVINYVAGLLNVGLWPFVWTTAVGIIPFEILAGGVFLGISGGLIPGLIVGAVALAGLGGLSYVFRARWHAAQAREAESESADSGGGQPSSEDGG